MPPSLGSGTTYRLTALPPYRLTAHRLPSGLLRLVHVPQFAHHRRIRQRGGITQRAPLGNVLEEAPHDLPAAGLGQIGRKEDVVRAGDRADLHDYVGLELVLESRRALLPLFQRDEG